MAVLLTNIIYLSKKYIEVEKKYTAVYDTVSIAKDAAELIEQNMTGATR